MKNRKRTAQSAFFNVRALVGLLVCGTAACSMLSGALLAFFRSEVLANSSQRTLTFAERVAYQRAVEEVYWRHRIWPKANADPKPPLEAMMSEEKLENKVADYLGKSQARERQITAEQLQAEMNRMAQHTKQPEVLQELFEALDNDPFVIAECLARPVLVERLLVTSRTDDQRINKAQTHLPVTVRALSANYTLPAIASPSGTCIDDTWTPTSTTNTPSARDTHTAVWTGSEMIVWGGYDGVSGVNSGGRYDPSTDSWTTINTTNAPSGRWVHTAVWSGSEMIVWGGFDGSTRLNTGGRYDPSTDSWTATSVTNAPSARSDHSAVWTGSHMIVWSGWNGVTFFNTGGRYNPNTDSWTATSTTNGPEARREHSAVWTGNEMIVWGGFDGSTRLNTGGRYDPGTDSWMATSTIAAPAARDQHTAIWTGSEMIVWGGVGSSDLNSGGTYDPNTDSWTATGTANAPCARFLHTAIWSGNEMIVWGGLATTDLNTGGRYCAQSGPTPTPTATAQRLQQQLRGRRHRRQLRQPRPRSRPRLLRRRQLFTLRQRLRR